MADADEPFQAALVANDGAAVQRLLAGDAGRLVACESAQRSGSALLAAACAAGADAVVDALLEAGVRADAIIDPQSGWQAIHEAASRGHAGCVLVLAHAAPDCVNALTASGATPLRLAADAGHTAVVHTLRDCGARDPLADDAVEPPVQAAPAPLAATDAQRLRLRGTPMVTVESTGARDAMRA